MYIAARFDPTQQGSTTAIVPLQLPFSSGKLRLFVINASSVSVDFSFNNGHIVHSPAKSRRFFEEEVNSGLIGWQVVSYAGSYIQAQPPITIEIYERGEAPPNVASDVSPVPQPQGQIQFTTFINTQTKTITLNNVAGQLLVLDGWDMTAIGPSTGSGPVLTITVNANGLSIPYTYFLQSGTNTPGVFDHVSYPNRAMPQAAGQNITLVETLSATIGSGSPGLLVAKYHYEINF